jgi:hypothetical protein
MPTTRRQPLDKRHYLAPPKLLPDNNLLGRINAVNLEHVLGEIKTNRGNLHLATNFASMLWSAA